LNYLVSMGGSSCVPGFLVYFLLVIDKHCHGLSSARNMGSP
jgi:hypothetical protein